MINIVVIVIPVIIVVVAYLVTDSSIAIKTGGCFSDDVTVQLESGAIRQMSDLRVNDRLLTVDTATGQLAYDDVIAFIHRDADQPMTFVELSTQDGGRLTVTADHLVYAVVGGDSVADQTDDAFDSNVTRNKIARIVNKRDRDAAMANETNEPSFVFAGDVQIGDFLVAVSSAENATLRHVRVVDVRVTSRAGVYAPMTSRGTIIAGGLTASCYAAVDSHSLAHASMLPLRLAAALTPRAAREINFKDRASRDVTQRDVAGVHWYASVLQRVGEYVLPRQLWFAST